ncbi:MAG TPA: hypothetical protein VN493_14685 [Thermoanaerobaculia bacterium]|nr:hypothetical protein [Thermoanaerobaculia bacterium]
MTIHQFAKQLERGGRSPLLEAVQALRTRDLDQLRGPGEGLFTGWTVWEEGIPAQTPQTYAARPELRN